MVKIWFSLLLYLERLWIFVFFKNQIGLNWLPGVLNQITSNYQVSFIRALRHKPRNDNNNLEIWKRKSSILANYLATSPPPFIKPKTSNLNSCYWTVNFRILLWISTTICIMYYFTLYCFHPDFSSFENWSVLMTGWDVCVLYFVHYVIWSQYGLYLQHRRSRLVSYPWSLIVMWDGVIKFKLDWFERIAEIIVGSAQAFHEDGNRKYCKGRETERKVWV